MPIKTPKKIRSTPPAIVEPLTPTKTTEPVSPSPTGPVLRRSLRLSSSSKFTPSPKRTRNDAVSSADFARTPKRSRNDAVSSANTLGKSPNFDQINNDSSFRVSDGVMDCVKELGQNNVINQEIGGNEFLSLGSGTRVVKLLSIGGVNDEICNSYVELDGVIDSVIDNVKELGQNDVINQENVGNIGDVKRLSIDGVNEDVGSSGVEVDVLIGSVIHDVKQLGQNEGINQESKGDEFLSLRSGARVVKRLSIGDVDEDVGNTGVGLNGVFGRVIDDVKELGQNEGINEGNEFLSLLSGSRVVKRLSIGGDVEGVGNVRVSDVIKELGQNDGSKEENWENGDADDIGKVVRNNGEVDLEVKEEEGGVIGGESIVKSLRKYSSEEKGKRRLIVDDQGGVGNVEEDDGLGTFVVEEGWSSQWTIPREKTMRSDFIVDDQDVAHRVEEDYSSVFLPGEINMRSPRWYTRDEKGKRRWIVDDEGDVAQVEKGGFSSFLVKEGLRYAVEEKVKRDSIVDDEGGVYDAWSSFSVEEGLGSPERYTREEKGKGVACSDDVASGGNDDEGLGTVNLELGLDLSGVGLNSGMVADQGINMVGEVNEGDNVLEDPLLGKQKSMREIHKKIARSNASKYAHFSVDDVENENEGTGREQEDGDDTESEAEVPQDDRGLNVEDWPGPFSTAMKIIRDREKNMGVQGKNSCSSIGSMPLISWMPKNERFAERKKQSVPPLKTMCLKILAENVDAIHSLNYVPEVLRHTLSQMLCDSRRMNAHFFSLLLEGAPAEIRIADCSWLEEEEFESSIKACDTSKLTVLQLDLCGHCVSDSSLLKAIAPKGLPVLTTISLKGACRISDSCLAAVVSAAPVLRSMNLSQCSLLTDVAIKTIADSLGSIVHELYLDDCDTLEAMSILPSLKRLVHLEVLSLRGIGGVSDKFIKKLITSNGQNMKELVLANCVKLTDSSLKVITERCSQLCVLDLSYLRKLTDVGLAYLTNGCIGIQELRLCRNAFSDDAIAAFLEASGQYLKELSLNNVTKVGQNSTLSLARRCQNLESLDLSWCRNLTDEAMGLIADSCMSLRLLKIFGCTQITKTFIDGHSNPHLHIVGMKLTPILEHIKRPDFQHGPLYYSAVPSS